MVSAILFDVDGTLVDSNDLHAVAWREAFRHFGHDVGLDRIRGQIGKGGDNLIPALLPELGEAQRDEIDAWRGDLFKRDYLPSVVPFPKVRPLFERIQAEGRRIVLASSSNEEEVAYHLNLVGAADLVHATTSRSDVAHSKPCPDIFAAALGKLAPIDPADAVVVGDSPYDMEAAGRIGVPAIGVLCGGFDEAELRGAGALEIYRDPSDLLDRYEASLLAR